MLYCVKDLDHAMFSCAIGLMAPTCWKWLRYIGTLRAAMKTVNFGVRDCAYHFFLWIYCSELILFLIHRSVRWVNGFWLEEQILRCEHQVNTWKHLPQTSNQISRPHKNVYCNFECWTVKSMSLAWTLQLLVLMRVAGIQDIWGAFKK